MGAVVLISDMTDMINQYTIWLFNIAMENHHFKYVNHL